MMALEEKTKIWIAIKAALPFINASGINSVELLLWSQDKDLDEVRTRLGEIKDVLEEEGKTTDVKEEENEDMEELEDEILLEQSQEQIVKE